MMAKIPDWCWRITWLLAFSAGNINVLGILGAGHHTITHLTGTTSLLAIATSGFQMPAILHFGATIFAFVSGAVLSGVIIQDVSFQLGRRYPISLLLVSLLLLASAVLLRSNNIFGVYTAASACGLQNAMMTTFSSATIRTTHLSGMFTDIGIYIGHALRGLPVDSLRIRLCVIIISGYFMGGVVGAWLYSQIRFDAIYVSFAISLISALLFWIRTDRAVH